MAYLVMACMVMAYTVARLCVGKLVEDVLHHLFAFNSLHRPVCRLGDTICRAFEEGRRL